MKVESESLHLIGNCIVPRSLLDQRLTYWRERIEAARAAGTLIEDPVPCTLYDLYHNEKGDLCMPDLTVPCPTTPDLELALDAVSTLINQMGTEYVDEGFVKAKTCLNYLGRLIKSYDDLVKLHNAMVADLRGQIEDLQKVIAVNEDDEDDDLVKLKDIGEDLPHE